MIRDYDIFMGCSQENDCADTFVKSYKVGDYYSGNGKEGVVFEVDKTGRHGKIVGLKQAEKQWDTLGFLPKNWGDLPLGAFEKMIFESEEYKRKLATNATDMHNGMKNMQTIMHIPDWRGQYPAFAWCAEQGDGWYLPAVKELTKFTLDDSVHEAVNRTLSDKGGDLLFAKGDVAFYWSSSEREDARLSAWGVGMYCGGIGNGDKYDDEYVRAVAAF